MGSEAAWGAQAVPHKQALGPEHLSAVPARREEISCCCRELGAWDRQGKTGNIPEIPWAELKV